MPDKGQHYCVLYTQVIKQEKVSEYLNMNLPAGRGNIFYPCKEVYRRDRGGKVVKQPVFPGYIFVRSDMMADELHEFLLNNRGCLDSFIKELQLTERRLSGEGFTSVNHDKQGADNGGYSFSDLSDDEAAFFDFLLDMDDNNGTLRMSSGYRDGKSRDGRQIYRVMEGPLKVYEKHIIKVNVQDKRAYLDFGIGDCLLSAGFDVKAKKYWFPEDEGAPDMLADGTEIDIDSLVRNMTNLK